MALSSMTGFARCNGTSGAYAWAWELRSVNGKNLDLRLRLPPGWDAVEAPVRARAAEALSRGTIYGTLSARREGVAPLVRVNEPVLAAVLATLREVARRVEAAPARLDGILALKGVIEVTDQEESEEDRRAAELAVIGGFGEALAALAGMRRQEGAALAGVLGTRLDEIGRLAARAEAAPGRRPEAIRSRLAEQVAVLVGASDRFDAWTGSPRMSSRGATCWRRAAPSDAGSIFWRRSCSARPTPCAPSRTMWSSPTSDSSSRAWSSSSASRFRIWSEARGGNAAGRTQGWPIARRGLMLVLSSPSGAGKTTLSRLLLERDSAVTLSVSVTTRPSRPGEIDGRDYHFIDSERFQAMVARGDLLEWARVFDHCYGTPRAPAAAALAAGRDVLFDIDWQGTQQLREQARSDLASIFVLPPSIEELEKRRRSRAQDPEDVIRRRMTKATEEMSHWAEYDYVVVNADIEQAFADVRAILAAERLKRERRSGLSAFVRELQGKL